jgi:hypothetical protein
LPLCDNLVDVVGAIRSYCNIYYYHGLRAVS